MIEGYYFGTTDQKVVWTGSQIYTYPALRFNDEVLLRVHSGTMHDAFRQNFNTLAHASGVSAIS